MVHTSDIPVLATTSDVWRQAMTSPLAVTCLLIGLVCVFGLLVAGSAMGRLRPAKRDTGPQRQLAADRGTATIEFTLVLPVLLFFALMLTQTTLLMGGNMFVHYAAFAATRSAAVQVPADLGALGEPANEIRLDDGSEKRQRVRASAVYALVPVSGRLEGDAGSRGYAEAFAGFYGAYGQTPPAWVDRLLEPRLRYADQATDVQWLVTTTPSPDRVEFLAPSPNVPGRPTYRYGPRDAISVEVQHELHLSVPVASAIFADGRNDAGRYTLVTGRYTLTNEGLSDQLPRPPALPRDQNP